MEKSIKIGWGKRSIAKEGPVPITGQFYLRISQGVYTPVMINALVIENGDDSVIFASADMVSVQPEMLLKAQEILQKECPEIPGEKIIANATHTHAGPSSNKVSCEYPNKVEFTGNDEMIEYLGRQLADAVKDAWLNRAEGSVAYGYGFATTGHSRRTIYLDDIGLRKGGVPGLAVNGRGMMYGNTNDEMFDGYEAGSDSFINLFYTFDKNGKLTGAVINVPCPSQTGEHAWVFHASFWHNVREKLAEKYGEVGVIGQAAAAGDLSPRQLHYLAAEKRRYNLKYADKVAEFKKNPWPIVSDKPVSQEDYQRQLDYNLIEAMRAEDIANRIVTAFDEVLSWAGSEKLSALDIRHEIRTVNLSRRMFPQELVEEEKRNYANAMQEEYITDGGPYEMLTANSRLTSRRNRSKGVISRSEIQDKEPYITTVIHAVKLGDVAFASNRFELYMDYMHRIQSRSPFLQTFIIQLVSDRFGSGSYLATERAIANKGYSATPYCNQVSPEGGQELVNETLDMLNKII